MLGLDVLELDGTTLTEPEFAERCLIPNVPAIIRNCGESFRMSSLRAHLVPSTMVKILGSSHRAPVSGKNGCSVCEIRSFFEKNESNLYLKDWHLARELSMLDDESMSSAVDRLYTVPPYFSNDWLNDYCLRPRAGSTGDDADEFGNATSDYRFAYIGPEGSQTLNHYDVFGSYSWSLNVAGLKLWIFPTHLSNEQLRLRFPPGRDDARPVDLRVTTEYELVSVVQRPGDAVFVPSHYYHQVHNIEGEVLLGCAFPLVVSVNHNWINEHCIAISTAILCREAQAFQEMVGEEAKLALSEDWPVLVNKSLMSSGSWDLSVMTKFLKFCRVKYAAGDQSAPKIRSPLDRAEALLEQTVATVLTSKK